MVSVPVTACGRHTEPAVTPIGTRGSGSARPGRRAGAARYQSAIVEAHRAGLEENSAQLDRDTTGIGQVAAADLARHRRVGACSRRASQDLAEIQDASRADADAKTAGATGSGDGMRAGRVDHTFRPVAPAAAADDSAGVVDDLAGRAGRSAVGPPVPPAPPPYWLNPLLNLTSGRPPGVCTVPPAPAPPVICPLFVTTPPPRELRPRPPKPEPPGPSVAVPPKPAPPMPPVITPVVALVNEPPKKLRRYRCRKS